MTPSPVPGPVLLVTGEYPPARGGIADYTQRLANALATQGEPLQVITRSTSRAQSFARPPWIDRWDIRLLPTLARHAPTNAIVHLQYQPAAFDLRGAVCLLPLYLRLRRPDLRTAVTFHDARVPYLFKGAGPLRSASVKLLARTAHAAIAAEPTDLAQLGVPPPGHLIPIGSNVDCHPPADFDRAAFRRRLGVDANDLVVTYFGFLNQSKGLSTLVGTMRRVLAAEPTARLLLLGGATGASDPTDTRSAANFEQQLDPLAERTLRTGYLPNQDLSAHLLAADVVLLPYSDGASLRRGSLLACAVHQLPIVTTRLAPLAAPLAETVLAESVSDQQALASAVLRVHRDPALKSRLRAATARLSGLVAWDRIAAQHRRVYAILRAC